MYKEDTLIDEIMLGSSLFSLKPVVGVVVGL